MTNKGMRALLLSALLLDGLSLSSVPALADETHHGRRKHKHRHGEPIPDTPDPESNASKGVPSSQLGSSPAVVSSPSAAQGAPVVISPPPGQTGAAPLPPAAPPGTIVIAPSQGAFPTAPASPGVFSAPPTSVAPHVPPTPTPYRPAVLQANDPERSQFAVRSPSKPPPYKTLGIAGLGVVGSSFALSLVLGGISYGAFLEGQWGWFVPVAGPVLVMSGVCGSPGSSCYFKSVFTYTMGPLTTVTYLTGITLAIVGAAGHKRGLTANRLQLLPYASLDSRGLVLVGSF